MFNIMIYRFKLIYSHKVFILIRKVSGKKSNIKIFEYLIY